MLTSGSCNVVIRRSTLQRIIPYLFFSLFQLGRTWFAAASARCVTSASSARWRTRRVAGRPQRTCRAPLLPRCALTPPSLRTYTWLMGTTTQCSVEAGDGDRDATIIDYWWIGLVRVFVQLLKCLVQIFGNCELCRDSWMLVNNCRFSTFVRVIIVTRRSLSWLVGERVELCLAMFVEGYVRCWRTRTSGEFELNLSSKLCALKDWWCSGFVLVWYSAVMTYTVRYWRNVRRPAVCAVCVSRAMLERCASVAPLR